MTIEQRTRRLESRINQLSSSVHRLMQIRYTQNNYIEKLRIKHVGVSMKTKAMFRLSHREILRLKQLANKKEAIAATMFSKGKQQKFIHYFTLIEKQKIRRFLKTDLRSKRG